MKKYFIAVALVFLSLGLIESSSNILYAGPTQSPTPRPSIKPSTKPSPSPSHTPKPSASPSPSVSPSPSPATCTAAESEGCESQTATHTSTCSWNSLQKTALCSGTVSVPNCPSVSKCKDKGVTCGGGSGKSGTVNEAANECGRQACAGVTKEKIEESAPECSYTLTRSCVCE